MRVLQTFTALSRWRRQVLAMLVVWASGSIVLAAQDVEWATFQSPEAGFEISYPARWQVVAARTRSSPGTVRSTDVLEQGESHKITFQEGDEWPGEFQIRRLEAPDRVSLEAVFGEFDLSDVWNGSAADALLSGHPAKTWVRWRHDSLWREYLTIASNRVFHLRFDESNVNDPDFNSHQRIYAQMMASLRIR